MKRANGAFCLEQQSQIRYIHYYSKFLKFVENQNFVHHPIVTNPPEIKIVKILMYPVPMSDLQQKGCRPLIKLYDERGFIEKKKCIYKTDSDRKFQQEDPCVVIYLDTTLKGDVMIKCYHSTIINLLSTKKKYPYVSSSISYLLYNRWHILRL